MAKEFLTLSAETLSPSELSALKAVATYKVFPYAVAANGSVSAQWTPSRHMTTRCAEGDKRVVSKATNVVEEDDCLRD